MTEPTPANYDDVPYPTRAQVATHPDRLATIAALLGVETAPITACRVLELGCGNGTNLLAMASGLPGSEFLGVDAAALPIVQGTQTIAELGLKNVRLEQRDLLEFKPAAGTFDYIISHGVYSWVPGPVRDRILAICAQCLAPNGIAYVSYNAYPGCHFRDLARQMMLYHVRDTADTGQKVGQGRALMNFLSTSKNQPDLYQMILAKELDRITDNNENVFFHDDLNPINQPVYFHQFAEHAAQHGLQFLSEAIFSEIDPADYTPATLAALRELDEDPLAREQYLDFLMFRRFRRTLLCRQEVALDHGIDPGAITKLYAASKAQADAANPDLQSSTRVLFRAANNASIETGRPLFKAAIWHLSQRWPEAVPFADLLTAARQLAGTAPSADGDQEERRALCDLLLRTYTARVTELHVWSPPFVTKVSARPLASALARLESRHQTMVPTLWHNSIELQDGMIRHLLGLLDGTRDAEALIDALVLFAETGGAQLSQDGTPVTDPAQIRALVKNDLPITLQKFASGAVLVG